MKSRKNSILNLHPASMWIRMREVNPNITLSGTIPLYEDLEIFVEFYDSRGD